MMSGIVPYQTPYSVEQIENMKVIYGYNKDDQASREDATQNQKQFNSWGGKVNLFYTPTGRPATDDDLVRFPDKVQVEIIYENKYNKKSSTTSTSKLSNKGSKKSSSKKAVASAASKRAKKVGRPKKKDSNATTTATTDTVIPDVTSPDASDSRMLVETVPATEPKLVALGGWTKKTFLRQSGAAKGNMDTYWYSPKLQKQFRSMAEVKKFLRFLEKARGNEQEAYNIYKGRLSL